eukprot:3062977-Pyramimonas_sp.AAC.1
MVPTYARRRWDGCRSRSTEEPSSSLRTLWAEIDGETADEDAMRIHLAEVEKCRASLLREAHLLKAHRELLDLVSRDIYRHRPDMP